MPIRYVPKVYLVFRLPIPDEQGGGRVVISRLCPSTQSLGACARTVWPEMPPEARIMHGGTELAQNESIGQLGLQNDTELEVLM